MFGGELTAAPHAGGFRVQASLHTTDPHARGVPALDMQANGTPQ